MRSLPEAVAGWAVSELKARARVCVHVWWMHLESLENVHDCKANVTFH